MIFPAENTMDVRVARLEADVAHIKTDLASTRTNDARYTSIESRIATVADELRAFRIDVASLKGVEKLLLSTTAISFALAILAIIIAVSDRHEEPLQRSAATPPAINEGAVPGDHRDPR